MGRSGFAEWGETRMPMIGGNIPHITWKYYDYKALKWLFDYLTIAG